MSKPLPDEAEIYIQKAKNRATPSGQTMEKLATMKDNEINDTMKDIELIRARKALQDVKQGIGGGNTTNAVIARLFEGRTVEEINDMLSKMTPEAVDNLVRIASTLDTNPVNLAFRQQPQASKDDTINTLLLKYVLDQKSQPQQAITVKDIVEIVKVVNDMRPQPQIVSGGGGSSINSTEMLKLILEFNRPLYDQLKSKDKELVDAKLKEIEARMPGSLEEQINYVKEMAPILGLSGKQTNELDLKLEEMRENREIDMKRLDWEQRKFEMENDADAQKWESIGKILQGPVGDVIKNVGTAGADRVRGQPQRVSRAPKIVQTQCPNCKKPIFVDSEAETAICGNCGVQLQRQGTAPPEPEPTHVDVEPPQNPVATSNAPTPQPTEQVDEEEQQEEEENGRPETTTTEK